MVIRLPIVKVHHDKDFYQATNATVNDARLSFKARGILAYLLSKPDHWKVVIADLVNHSTDGERAVRAGLRELKGYGYARQTKIRDERGQFIEWEYTIYECPDAHNGNLDST